MDTLTTLSLAKAEKSLMGEGIHAQAAARLDPAPPQLHAAIAALQVLIRQHYPTATFAVTSGTDPEGTYVLVTLDVADPDAVVDVSIDRLLELQIDAGLPPYVIPLRAPARVTSILS